MKATLNRLASRATSFLLHGRRPRLDHPDSHLAGRANQHAGVIDHYIPSLPGGGGGMPR
ncbi:hypothetical protein BG653_04788 [Streptomyces platensis]|uniref:Uncharacterized protein n=1 Tax=Streptomyces platensis TaxID=58346 RepID=A0ABX3XSV2_STRPT|nr:hypothetical protein BG653_04788 [Streptomyces platensis]